MGTTDDDPRDGRKDLERAIGELADRLPGPLAPMARLAFNYRWTWLPGGAAVFAALDPGLWRRSCSNPRWLIEAVAPRRLRELARDAGYVERVRRLAADVADDLARPPAAGPIPAARPVAYLCSEFGVHCSLPLYGGGLGILAGDVLKTASDVALPLVGVGLLYREGYFHQRIDLAGWQHEYWITNDFERAPVVLVTGADGTPVTVEVEIRRRPVRIQVWRADVGRVPLYLLDTDRPDNDVIDRWITARLYVGDRHTRLAQYAVLGIGGTRMLAALGVRPHLVHLNEGHAALGALERLRVRLDEGQPLEAALGAVRNETVFTTHTPVDAGNEWYSPAEIEPVLGGFADTLGACRHVFYELGRVPGSASEPVNITPLALRVSRAANAVSRRHGEVARGMWRRLWPDRPAAQVPIGHVTNGVHASTWMADAMQALLDRHLAPDWRRRVDDRAVWEDTAAIPDDELWAVRRTLRAALVDLVRERSVADRLSRGEAAAYVEAAADVFDPNVLTIGFARRVATYKRLHLLIRQLERGLRLLSNGARPVQIVLAGKAHPLDEDAKQTLRAVFGVRHDPLVGSRIVFLEDYDLRVALQVIAGADLWVNLPRPPFEASGTSGMKAVLNGGLNLSVLDGWWVEAHDGETGWAIATPEGDAQRQDDHDATALFDLLEREVLPLFYERDDAGIPRAWLARVKVAMRRLIPTFNAQRMLREYVATLYAPGGGIPRSS